MYLRQSTPKHGILARCALNGAEKQQQQKKHC